MLGDSALLFFFFQAEDGIRDLVRSRGLGDVYKRQGTWRPARRLRLSRRSSASPRPAPCAASGWWWCIACLLYTSDAADERSSVDLGGRRIIKKKTEAATRRSSILTETSDQYS